MRELEYPFDSDYILSHKKKLRRQLMGENAGRDVIHKKIAVLGGSTTSDICQILDLFLLNYGIEAEFYESEYDQYYQDAMFPNEELETFAPDLIFIHTTNRNIINRPEPGIGKAAAAERGLKKLNGYYYPTAKNNMVRKFYATQGFTKVSEDADGATVWTLDVEGYKKQNTVIQVET